eukprot:scaffold3720_cov401-Prasinococcus_capsulatus_cf.AAC.14
MSCEKLSGLVVRWRRPCFEACRVGTMENARSIEPSVAGTDMSATCSLCFLLPKQGHRLVGVGGRHRSCNETTSPRTPVICPLASAPACWQPHSAASGATEGRPCVFL